MPTHLRALVVILVLATIVFAFVRKPACALAINTGDFERRRNLWFAITLVAFLAHNFWIYIVATAVLLLLALPREPNKLAMYFFLLFAVPSIQAQISGLGVIQHVFIIHYLRLLALVVLLAAFVSLRSQPDTERFGRSLPDKLIAGYLILQLALMLTVSTFTNSMRFGVFYAFIDVFLPYYVASRAIRNIEGFRDTLMSFVVAAMVLGTIGVFESGRHWLLYTDLDTALGVYWQFGNYLTRGDGIVRAQGTIGQPIPFGYVMAVAVGLYLFLQRSVGSPVTWWGLGLCVLLAGLVASISRGPWVGAVVMLLVFLATSPSPAKRLLQIGLLGIVVFSVLLTTPYGDKIVALLPFIGSDTEADGTVSYRQRLLAIGIEVILQNPFFGAYDYFLSSEMQDLKQGNGMIDLVNSYLAIGLSSGLVGLSLFTGFFIAVAIGIFKGMRKLPDKSSELHVLGQALLATLAGIMVIIFTTSSITVIPVIYWAVGGLGVAYVRLLTLANAPAKTPETAKQGQFPPLPVKNARPLIYRY